MSSIRKGALRNSLRLAASFRSGIGQSGKRSRGLTGAITTLLRDQLPRLYSWERENANARTVEALVCAFDSQHLKFAEGSFDNIENFVVALRVRRLEEKPGVD